LQLPIRGLPFEVPTYSLTGDILAFQRCGLQYRYYNRSALPPSRPVQLWTGEFTHGVMEEAFLYWRDYATPFPWPCNQTPWPAPTSSPNRLPNDIGELGDQVEARLRAAGKTPRSTIARDAAYRRVKAAINLLGPQLFPLITTVEEKISSTRLMPNLPNMAGQAKRGDRYELTGRVDVISGVSLSQHKNNLLVQQIQQNTTNLDGQDTFDVIVDYKAARRPPITPDHGQKDYWKFEAWQVQTYAWLRAQQLTANPVKAGILIYVNELSPSSQDIEELKKEVAQNRTDVSPTHGSSDYYALHTWQSGNAIVGFSNQFLLNRAIRIVPVDQVHQDQAVGEIDKVVENIELCALNENTTGIIPSNWQANGGYQDCDACDFRHFCPNPAKARGKTVYTIQAPMAPG
jgi:hypothetical protein